MATPTDHRPALAEQLTVWSLVATWPLYSVGGLYLAGPALGWCLAALVFYRWYIGPALPDHARPPALSGEIWAWLGGMLVMLAVLIIGHVNFGLGAGQTIKSVIGWAKGWALLALFVLAGYALPIRIEALARASCRVGRMTLFLLPLFLAAPFIGLPQALFVSPLKVLGGSTDQYFQVMLYTIEPGVGTPRWQFFAPWSPAAGFIGLILLLITREEPDLAWRWTGYVGSFALIALSQSRLALLALIVVLAINWIVARFRRPALWLTAAPIGMIAGWFAPQVLALIDQAMADFAGARADSSRVRATLGRIAIERWQNEALWFGHGIVERGPHLVEYMPIGSHHTWYGLLFVKGLLGAAALAVPMVWTLAAALRLALQAQIGRLALSLVLVFWLFSFGENLEALAYLTWPGQLALGIALRSRITAGTPASIDSQSTG